jgi:hypothetical protein
MLLCSFGTEEETKQPLHSIDISRLAAASFLVSPGVTIAQVSGRTEGIPWRVALSGSVF